MSMRRGASAERNPSGADAEDVAAGPGADDPGAVVEDVEDEAGSTTTTPLGWVAGAAASDCAQIPRPARPIRGMLSTDHLFTAPPSLAGGSTLGREGEAGMRH